MLSKTSRIQKEIKSNKHAEIIMFSKTVSKTRDVLINKIENDLDNNKTKNKNKINVTELEIIRENRTRKHFVNSSPSDKTSLAVLKCKNGYSVSQTNATSKEKEKNKLTSPNKNKNNNKFKIILPKINQKNLIDNVELNDKSDKITIKPKTRSQTNIYIQRANYDHNNIKESYDKFASIRKSYFKEKNIHAFNKEPAARIYYVRYNITYSM
jgi:hypothetical protein